jgi:hypothetical protein
MQKPLWWRWIKCNLCICVPVHTDHCISVFGTAGIGRRRGEPNFKIAAHKPEVEITFERQMIVIRFQRLLPHFRPCPTQKLHCRHGHMSTSISWYRVAISNRSKLFQLPVWRPTSGNVGIAINESGINVGVAVEIAAPSLAVQRLRQRQTCTIG